MLSGMGNIYFQGHLTAHRIQLTIILENSFKRSFPLDYVPEVKKVWYQILADILRERENFLKQLNVRP